MEPIKISTHLNSTLSAMFGSKVLNTSALMSVYGSVINLVHHDRDSLISMKHSYSSQVQPFTLVDRGYFESLVVNHFVGGKDANESIIFEKAKDLKKIKILPSKIFNFAPLEKSLVDRVKELTDLIPNDIKGDCFYHDGLVRTVLRPTNLTHGILAFRVVNLGLFRSCLFEIIVNEIEKLNECVKEGKNVDEYRKSVVEKIHQCGLELISENTLGQYGVYGDKYTDPHQWILTPWIEGADRRVLKSGTNYYTHTGWHDVKKEGWPIIYPEDVVCYFDEESCEDIKSLMDTIVTPISGAMDLRVSDKSGTAYFLEASHSYSSERYQEEFIHLMIINTLKLVLNKYNTLIGTRNDGMEDRRVAHFESLKNEDEPKDIIDTVDDLK